MRGVQFCLIFRGTPLAFALVGAPFVVDLVPTVQLVGVEKLLHEGVDFFLWNLGASVVFELVHLKNNEALIMS